MQYDIFMNSLCVGNGFLVGYLDSFIDNLFESGAFYGLLYGFGIGPLGLDIGDNLISEYSWRNGLHGEQTAEIFPLIANDDYICEKGQSCIDLVFNQNWSYVLAPGCDDQFLDSACN